MASSLTALVLHEDCSLHDTGWKHPEHQGRLPAVVNALYKETPLLQDLTLQLSGVPIDESELLRVHTEAHVSRLKAARDRSVETQQIIPLDNDTMMSPASWDAMLASAGCVITTCDAVLKGDARNGFALSRPPGHHATKGIAMGFCLANNVAIAARWLQQHGMQRVMIIDWDVHHGNGTQDIFYDDATVYYMSTHQSPWYPGTGRREERGVGAGLNATRNVPMRAGTNGKDFVDTYKRELDDALNEFTPDFVIVSAGFDCLAGDPLGEFLLEPRDLHEITKHLMEIIPHGRIVHALEGGYNPPRVGAGVVDVVRALTNQYPAGNGN
ncbi:MAG TPA: histone deacetylase [Longimicrobiales bacterium]|nr:histone deacetylase [Longimicrobiales bacterium]